MSVSSNLLHRMLIAVSILLPASAFVAATYMKHADIVRQDKVTIERTSVILVEHASKIFDTVEQVLGRIDDRINGKDWAEIASPETNSFLRGINQSLPQSVSIWIADRDGVLRAGTMPAGIGMNVNDTEWFQRQRDREVGIYISPPIIGKASNTASFAISRRRTTPGTDFDGVIVVALSPDYFERFFRDASPSGTNVASLVRRDGAFIARIPSRTKGLRLAPTSPLMRAIANNPRGDMISMVSSIDGRSLNFAYRRVGDYPVYIGFGIDEIDTLRRWYGHVTVYAAMTLASILTLSFFAILAMKRARSAQETLQRLNRESEQRLVTEQRLRQSQKMESLGQLTGGIAHDFNNLLSVILSNLEMLRNRVKGDEKAFQMVDRATRGAERGASLTQRLLAFSRRQDLSPQSISVPDLVEGMTDMLSLSLGPSIRFKTSFPEDLPLAKVDPNQLEVALLNLALNARDAMPDGGVITISGKAIVAGIDGGICLAPGTYVCVSVSDTGQGMDEETVSKAIDPFFTTKGTGKGTGLGLSMVHGLAVQSGGTFRISSTIGKGTSAEIWLPIGDHADQATKERAKATEAGFLRILLVDDDSLVLEATAAMLEDLGHTVTAVSSGSEAVEAMLKDPAIHVVVTDYAMPGMTGLELARTLRRRDPDLPIILATGHAGLSESMEMGIRKLTKPFRQEELAAALVEATFSRTT